MPEEVDVAAAAHDDRDVRRLSPAGDVLVLHEGQEGA
jgi:hypothetical protein